MKKYVNAKKILPERLIKEIQEYIEGAHLYIPQKSRKSWGSTNGSRDHLEKRNMEIQFLYQQHDLNINELANRFGLSEERIRSIIYEK
jgi:Mor family transcriptional regulator